MSRKKDKDIPIIDFDNMDFSDSPDEPRFIDEFVRDENGDLVMIVTRRNPNYEKALEELRAKRLK